MPTKKSQASDSLEGLTESYSNAPSTEAGGFMGFFKESFLPQGYPDSVSDDYVEYQIWDTVQAFCSSITGCLATHAVLKGVGVGDETATAAGATMTWLLKDGAGMIGRITFAWAKGTDLDCSAKKWRLFADVVNDATIMTELLLPLFASSYRVLVMSVVGVGRSLVGVAGGCTRAALTEHQAKRDNMGDVSAKDGSQETLVNLAALLVNLWLTPYASANATLTWVLFIVFTIFHLLANYKAVSAVVMETVNVARLRVLVQHFAIHEEMLSLKQANKLEPLLRRTPKTLRLGVSLVEMSKMTKREKCEHFIAGSDENGCCVSYHQGVTSEIVIRGAVVALGGKGFDVNKFMTEFKEKGWMTSRHHLGPGEWRWVDKTS